MQTNCNLFGIACRTAAFSFLLAGTASMMQAQQAASASVSAPLFLASSALPDLTATSGGSSSSSLDGVAQDHFDLTASAPDSSQPPPRRYGRPNYSNGNTNPDGSNKWTFMVGGALSLPIGNTHKYNTPSWAFQGGGGRNFSKTVGVLLQFDYDNFGLQGATIANEGYIYNYCTAAEYNAANCSPQGPAPSGTATPIDGNSHVWSFTLDPTFTVPTDGALGAYFVAGGGFYHKVTDFTTPTTETYCYYYCEEVEANATFDHYTSNAVGVNAGVGLTYKFSRFSNERFYVEGRYVVVFNQHETGVTPQNVATSPLNATNFFPANSNRTTYIPITVGLRF